MAPISLPDRWIWTTLKEVCSIVRGVTFPSEAQVDKPSETHIACLRTTNVQDQINWDDLIYIPRSYVQSKEKLICQNDILISIANSRELVGKVSFVDEVKEEAAFGGFISVIRASEFIDTFYLYSFLKAEGTQKRLRSVSNQTTNIANLTVAEIAQLPIPLPPLPEQKYIAAIIRQSNTLRLMRSESNSKTEQLLPSLFIQMFGRPDEWSKTKRLSTFVNFVGGGTPSRLVKKYFTGDIPWATSKDIKSRYLDDTQEHITEEAVSNSATNLVPSGSILVVVKSKILMHTLPIGITKKSFCFGQDIKGLICNSDVIPQFIVAAMLSQSGYILSQARGANTEGLTLDILRSIPIPDITVDKQKEFQDRVLVYNELENYAQISKHKLNNLHQSLLTQAFSGTLTAVWREKHKDELQHAAVERDMVLGLREEEDNSIDYKTGIITPEEVADFRNTLKPLLEQFTKDLAISAPAQDIVKTIFQQSYLSEFAKIATQIAGKVILTESLENAVGTLSEPKRRSIADFARVFQNSSPIMEILGTAVSSSKTQTAWSAISIIVDILDKWQLNQEIKTIELNDEQSNILNIIRGTKDYFSAESLSDASGLLLEDVRSTLELFQKSGLIMQVAIADEASSTPEFTIFAPTYRGVRSSDDSRHTDLGALEQNFEELNQ